MMTFLEHLANDHLSKFLTIINLTLSGVIAFLSTKGLIHMGRLTNSGKQVAVLYFITIVLSVYQNIYNDDQADQKEKAIRESYDSSLAAATDRNARKITQTAAEYYLRYDETQKELEKIVRDSSKTKVIVGQDPLLQLCPGEEIQFQKHENGYDGYLLNLCSIGSGCADVDIVYSTVYSDSLNKLSLQYGMISFFNINEDLALGTKKSQRFYVNLPSHYDTYYFWVRGSYKSIDLGKTFKINKVYCYYPRTKEVVLPEKGVKNRIEEFVRNKESKSNAL